VPYTALEVDIVSQVFMRHERRLQRSRRVTTYDWLAGGVGGMFGVAAGAPLDIVRVRQQQPGQAVASALRVFRDIVSREGKLSLFKGLAYPLYTASFQARLGRQRSRAG
jgi:hypothetical protein